MQTKSDKLKELDELVLSKMITILKGEEKTNLGDLSDLNTAVQYLAKNNITEVKKAADSIEDKVKSQLAAAEKRRAKGESK